MTIRSVFVRAVVCALLLMPSSGAAAIAAVVGGTSDQSSGKADALPTIPVRVDVVLTRFQGEKKVSSLPFSLLANATDRIEGSQPVSIRMGIDVPVGTTTQTDNRTMPEGTRGTHSVESASTKVQYRNVGTDIDCVAMRVDEGRFSIRVSISDSSIYSPDADGKLPKTADPAAFRTFSTSNTVVMRDGQAVLFGTGTDKISGETLKVEVTLHVAK
jgi:hypothetical protein